MTVLHSAILVSSLWRVFPITPSSQTDMPSLTTVTLSHAFRRRKTVHTKSASSSYPSFLDITPALQHYLFALFFTHHSNPVSPLPHINPYIGLKFPWLFNDEEGWYKTHRLGSYTWILAGIVSILHPLHNLVFVTVPLIIFLVGVVPLVYSLVLYFKRKRSN